jgi:peptidoglycan/LPS O-acetylase OafA/YrhL
MTTVAVVPGSGRSIRAFGGYQAGFDGIRGLGLIGMLLYHAQLGPVDGAYFALSLFFTLSGFLITAILLDGRRNTGTIDLGRFWTRRFRRLAPASLLGLVPTVIFGATVATRSQAEQLPQDVLGVITYSVNWVFVRTDQAYADLFASPSPVQHYWSLAVEEQFYVIVPLLLVALLRLRSSPRVMAAVVTGGVLGSTAWMYRLFDQGVSIDRLYYGTDTRLAEMLVGVLLAILMDQRGAEFSERARGVLGGVGVLALGAIAWMWTTIDLSDPFAFKGGFLLNAILTGLLILALIADRGPVATIFGWRPAAWLGRLSYGVYIYHFVIFLWLTEERTGLDSWPLFAVRVSLTLGVAYASNRFVEMPIRTGATLGLPFAPRLLVYPALGVILIIATAVTVDTTGDDPLATLRTDDDQTVPDTPLDEVLDIVVIHSAANEAVVDAFVSSLDTDATTSVTVAAPFTCTGGLVDSDGGQVCANWANEWPALIESADPDTVLFFVDGWEGDALADLAVSGATDDIAKATALLDAGIDLLTASDANVVWTASATTFEGAFLRALTPFSQAMNLVESRRDDLFALLSGAMPDPADLTASELVAESASVLRENAALYRRADRAGLLRVMVVGDSQARSLGYGLERWGPDNDVWVWNVAVNGCGIADEGFKYGSGTEEPVSEACTLVASEWVRQIEVFDPDLIVVFSSTWDLGLRRLDGWDEPALIGDPRVDDYLRREYLEAVDTLTSSGARIVWMQAPCLGVERQTDPTGISVDWLSPDVLGEYNTRLLPEVQAARPDLVTLFDLPAIICPGGSPIQEADGVSPIRGDGAHFGVDGSLWFAGRYGAELLGLEASS